MKNDLSKPEDLENLSKEELKEIEANLTERLTKIIEMASSRANKILEPYGLKATMAWDLKQK